MTRSAMKATRATRRRVQVARALGLALAVLAPGLLPSLAEAQEQARLRAGEHAGFSRIALDVPRLGEWDATRNGRILTVLFRDRELLFDTTQIFPGRRVSRVTSARSERGRDGTRLMLSLSCSCDAETYEFQPGMLVIDIRPENDEPSSVQPESAGASGDDGAAPTDRNGGGDPGGSDAQTAGSGLSSGPPARRLPSALDIKRDEPAPATSAILLEDPQSTPETVSPEAQATTATPQTSEPDEVTVSDAQRRLLQQLSRAADQGLVEFRSPEARGDARTGADAPADAAAEQPAETETAAEPRPQEEAPAADTASDASDAPEETTGSAASSPAPPETSPRDAPSTPPRTGPPPPTQLDARTAFDAAGPRPAPPGPEPCAAEPHLDPTAWLPVDAPYAEMAALRGALTVEFDRADPKAALALARLQTGLGFGIEARQVLEEFVPPIPEAAVLEDIARMADGDPAAPEGPLASANGCGGRAGMWRLAADYPPGPDELDDPDWGESVLDAFAELPLAIRRRVGPDLLDTLIQAGALDLAEEARLRLDRAPGDHGDAWRMSLGRLALARGDVASGDALLAAVVDHGGPLAPEAMLDLADSILARSDRLPDQLVEDIALAAFEHQGTLLGRRLLVAEILGRAGRDQLGVALDVIETELHAGGSRSEDLEAAMRAILERARAEDVGPLDYASAILAHRQLIGESPAFDPARVKVARELSGIGLSNAALDLLSPALTRNGAEARMAAAAADIAVGDPEAALERLAGLEGADPARLRARALAALNRNDEAYATVEAHLLDSGDERAELAWRGAAWDDAEALPDDDPRRLFARWMANRDAPPGSISPLAATPAPAPGTQTPSEAAGSGEPEQTATPEPFLSRPDLDAPPSLAGAREAIERSDRVRSLLLQALGGG